MGFAFCFFFCVASAIYLLLRQVDDETEFDEVYLEESEDRFSLPNLERAAGVEVETGASEPPPPLESNEAE
jgi:hypothetical protein